MKLQIQILNSVRKQMAKPSVAFKNKARYSRKEKYKKSNFGS